MVARPGSTEHAHSSGTKYGFSLERRFSLGKDEGLLSLASKGEVLFVRFCDRFLSLCLYRSNGAQSKESTRCTFMERTECERSVRSLCSFSASTL